ncbi:retrovirus-related pol polyprotein from transposon TNT 1-94 [Tanacetum coccineum]
MQNSIKEKFLVHVSLVQCKRAKICALYDYKGGLIEHYNKLWEYRQVVLESNLGSTCYLETEDRDDDGKITFKRMYICFKGIKQGWLDACRKVIGLDSYFLTHTCKGQLLTAIGRDGNNHMYPIAWAMVGVENKDNWAWFMSLLQEDLELGYGGGLTVISDRHKGLLEAVADFQDNELNVHQVFVDLPVNEAPENYTTEESQAEDPDPKPIVHTQESQIQTRSKIRKQVAATTSMRIFVKNSGRSERIAMMKAKKFKFAANGTRSTADKAFDVFKDEE